MRSRSDSALTGRCVRCYLTFEHCLCASLPVVSTRVRILVVRHALEALKSTNSARIAALVLPRLRIVSYGAKDEPFDAALLEGNPVLVYPPAPSVDARLVTPADLLPFLDDLLLVFPDGTWNQTRRMVKRLLALRPMRRLLLPDGVESRVKTRLRQPAVAGRVSTLEAITAALASLEGPEMAETMEEVQTRYVTHALRVKGRQRV